MKYSGLSGIDEVRAMHREGRLEVYDGGWGVDLEEPSNQHVGMDSVMISREEWDNSDEVSTFLFFNRFFFCCDGRRSFVLCLPISIKE